MRNIKLNETDFYNQDDKTQSNLIKAYCDTVQSYMNTGFSYSYSCSVAAAQSLFQKMVIMRICKKELSMIKMRDEYKQMKINQRKKFNQGVESADAVRLFNEVDNEK